MDFSEHTTDQLDALPDDIFGVFSHMDFQQYVKRSKELGREYLIGGKQELMDLDKPVYMKGAKSLDKNSGDWGIGIHACGPTYAEYPRAVDEDTFIKTMKEWQYRKKK